MWDFPKQKASTLLKTNNVDPKWIEQFTDLGETILDPFMGSGTTGCMCPTWPKVHRHRAQPKHFDIACRRIEQAYSQSRLFTDDAPKSEQDKLF